MAAETTRPPALDLTRGIPSTGPPSAYQQTSPLSTLVRTASSRRAHHDQTQPQQGLTPPRKPHAEQPAPISPLLHTEFRNSTATTAYSYNGDGDSYMVDDKRSTMDWANGNMGSRGTESMGAGADGSRLTPRSAGFSQNERIQSMASVYSDTDDVASAYGRQSWQQGEFAADGSRSSYTAGRHPIPPPLVSDGDFTPITPLSASSYNTTPTPSTSRAPSQLPTGRVANFSRPVPPVINGTEQRKREVLMRNSRARSPFSKSVKHESSSPSIVPAIRIEDTEPNFHPHSIPGSQSAPPSQQSFGGNPYLGGIPRAPSPSSNSLYSSYSYYPYDGAVDTPPTPGTPQFVTYVSGSQTSLHQHQHPRGLSPSPTPSTSKPKEVDSYELSSPDALSNPRTPQDYLQLGIAHHMANRLEESAKCFETSATLDSGCGVGMLMWGLALRHGWGVPPNEQKGFKWLRKAAEGAVMDLESAKAGMVDTSAIKSELVIAIYEVGQSFFRGWGVEKDKKMGVSYFRAAAGMGDPDAQQSLAFALEHGKGCKKDRKEAALWYRAAVKQGASDVGLAWIYKEKFQ